MNFKKAGRIIGVAILIIAGVVYFFGATKKSVPYLAEFPTPALKETPKARASRTIPASDIHIEWTNNSLAKIGIAWNKEIDESTTSKLAAWAENYREASAAEKLALEKEGIALAAERRIVLRDLIQTDPERALKLAVPVAVRRILPESVSSLLEERVSGRGDLNVLGALAEPGKENLVVPTFRTATFGEVEYSAFVYGRRLGEPTKKNIPLNGIVVGNFFAVNEKGVRILETTEVEQIQKTAEVVCSISGEKTTQHQDETVVDVGGEIVFLCQRAHAEVLNEKIVAADSGVASGADIQASLYTEGQKSLIAIRVDFPDLVGVPFSDTTGTNLISGLNGFYSESSYGRAGFALVGQGSDYTPTFRMPTNASYYGTNNLYNQLRTDARNAATAAGYVLDNYNFDLICMGSVPGFNWSGLGYVGATGAWLRNSFGTGVSAHELGHNFGLNHANFWDTSGLSIIGNTGTSVEYGDSFDTMGAASAGNNHFNARYKRYLNWLTTNEVTTVTTSGTYRVFCHDNTNSTGIRALNIAKNVSTNYWIEFRQKFTSNKWLMNGASLRWAQSGNQKSLLLDTSPGSYDAKTDAALVIGRTFSDKVSGIHITPIGKGGTVPESLDIVINKGAFPANVAPTITIFASATNISSGATALFSATAADGNADALAYYWDFGDGNFGTNGATASNSWTTGEYVVRCTVTDMRGGVASDSLIVKVGTPTTYRISGQILTNGVPVQGVRVYVAANRMTYTDSDGTYNLVGLPAATYTIDAQLDGYALYHPIFTNPISVGPNASGIDFSTASVLPPTITAQPQSRAVAAGSNVTFSVTASGGTPVSYRWQFNSATIANATNSSLIILDAQTTNAGNYSVVVSNAAAAVISSNATLTVNASPVLAAISNRVGLEESLLTFTASATDSGTVVYSLDPGYPSGAGIVDESGVFTWTPTEAQGPGIYSITVRATDNGTPPASVAKTFSVSVLESNKAPGLAPISNQFVNAGALLILTNFAVDSDFPTNSLNFTVSLNLVSGPSIDAATGVLSWIVPAAESVVTNTFTVFVSDNGTPSLNDSKNFNVVIIPPPQISSMNCLPDGSLTLTWRTFPGKTYQVQYKDSLLEASWENYRVAEISNGSTISVTDNMSVQPQRFYRILQLD